MINHLKNKLNKIVLMTFTRSSALEIKERVIKRFRNIESIYSEDIKIAIESLLITTIDGFCLKLIKQGLIEGVSTQIEISEEYEVGKKIELLCSEWIESRRNLPENLLKNSKSIISAMKFIFFSPEVRSYWKEESLNKRKVFDEDVFFEDLFRLMGMYKEWKKEIDLLEIDQFKEKGWYLLLKEINPIRVQKINIGVLKSIEEAFEKVPGFKLVKIYRKR